jgi:hypothetical protein
MRKAHADDPRKRNAASGSGSPAHEANRGAALREAVRKAIESLLEKARRR